MMGKQTCKYGIWGFHNKDITENTWVAKQNANHLGKGKAKAKHADVQTRV